MKILCFLAITFIAFGAFAGGKPAALSTAHTRTIDDFTASWKFRLGDLPDAQYDRVSDAAWRLLDLPHDWSIEGQFSAENPASPGGGALPGGIGWYRKSFATPPAAAGKLVFIEFDGVYRNSRVWINGHDLGFRPYGYSSFTYELTPFLKPAGEMNLLAVRVDNIAQPNSRWYSGSGIYRNVRLVTTDSVHVGHWGTFITTPAVSDARATVSVAVRVGNASLRPRQITLHTVLVDESGREVPLPDSICTIASGTEQEITRNAAVEHPLIWSIEHPRLYRAISTVLCGGAACDRTETAFGIRTFAFDPARGFSLNGKSTKIRGVCDHHDLGCLGAAINTRALERQLEILKGMGVNAIRTSHNPPAPELLDLADRMGFIVLDEAFDMWKRKKTDYDYAMNWDEWHVRDLTDMVLRDRNHPSVMIWSIGNEVMEQWFKDDPVGMAISRELASIVRKLDPTRPITAACNDQDTLNPVIRSGALDLIGYNYAHLTWADFPKKFPGKCFLGTETTSSLATRGSYDMPADTIRRWPLRWDLPFLTGNPDNTCSAYDNCSAPWGTTQEESWKLIKKYDFLSGMFIWTGFDYLGEPTPYTWPSRSSYFGIVDLAGFPKDTYYMYKSEWTDTPVLHIFPHWNWKPGDTVDVWAYTNCDEVELFLNGKSQGVKRKTGDDLHLAWRVPFAPGVLKAEGRSTGKKPLIQEVRTAGPAAKLELVPDRNVIHADGKDLSFVTVRVLDANGTLVPQAGHHITFDLRGPGRIAGVDNGLQTSPEPLKANAHDAFHGLCLAVVQSGGSEGPIVLTARAAGLKEASATITARGVQTP